MTNHAALCGVVALGTLLAIAACSAPPDQHVQVAAAEPAANQASRVETSQPATHDHVPAVEGEEIPAGDPIPTVKLTHDAMTQGVSAFTVITDFALTPASGPYRPMRGHFHVYVDGVERFMMSTPKFSVPGLTPGRHRVHVTLAATDHRTLLHHGQPIGDSVEVVVPDKPATGQAGARPSRRVSGS